MGHSYSHRSQLLSRVTATLMGLSYSHRSQLFSQGTNTAAEGGVASVDIFGQGTGSGLATAFGE